MFRMIAAVLALAAINGMASAASTERSGSYFCNVEFGGGLRYDKAHHKWESAEFEPDLKFVLRLKFRTTNSRTFGTRKYSYAQYEASITPAGMNKPVPCFGVTSIFPWLNDQGYLTCTSAKTEYKFNLDNNRFLSIYTHGYLDGDENPHTPGLLGGICTKIPTDSQG